MDELIGAASTSRRAWGWSVIVLGVVLALLAGVTGGLAAGLAGTASGVAAALFGAAGLEDAARGTWWLGLGLALLVVGGGASVLLRA
ncbi:hypothetical protein JOF53_002427 [Crossiella equi]|uniref:Major facilitator superfamily (MFS) profile domain-containing protein n=1 Tax=Crossiella equi TaxID=130796 RepID=A0ABS5AAE8_9PSEU|nr:hypothetical protein [Crossiella equi]MBP2473555.1 hypothetical protein [Crossiella equi]